MVSSETRPGTFPQHFRQPCSCIAVSGRGAGVGRFPLVAAVLSFEVAAQVIAFWAVPVRHLLGRAPNGLALGDHPGFEQVELDVPLHVGDGGFAGLAGGEVAGFLGFPRADPFGPVADGEAGDKDFEQERGEGEFLLVRGGKPRRYPSRRLGRAGS